MDPFTFGKHSVKSFIGEGNISGGLTFSYVRPRHRFLSHKGDKTTPEYSEFFVVSAEKIDNGYILSYDLKYVWETLGNLDDKSTQRYDNHVFGFLLEQDINKAPRIVADKLINLVRNRSATAINLSNALAHVSSGK